jgi:hypothetical protein
VLPKVLAEAPWVPSRKRAVLSLERLAREDRIVFSPGEREKWAHPGDGAEKKLEPWERHEILTKLAIKDIVRIDAATNLEKEDLVLALRDCDVRFIEHYGIARVLFAKFGVEAIDAIFALAETAPSSALEVLLHFDSLRVLEKVRRDFLIERWSERFPTTAAIHFLPAALGAESHERRAAITWLKWIRRAGHGEAIRDAARLYGPDALVELDALFAPEGLPSRAPTVPAFALASALPVVRLANGEAIEGEPRDRLLQLSTLVSIRPARDALETVKRACDRESLGAFAVALVEAWLAADAPSKERWALIVGGLFGDDAVARKLADWTAQWTKEKLHARARLALEALSLVSTDVALMHVDRLARTMKKGAIREHATATLEAIAKERNLSQEELADRLVPTFDLDPSGATWLDFGPRKFRVSFDETLAPELFDDSGARLERLPRPTATDDKPRAERALATYKGLVADTKKIAPDQVRRLERAMCTERSWSVAEFRRFFLDHPLMVHIAKRLVWLGSRGASFRITEERAFADSHDRDAALESDERVRIAHPIALASEVGAWSTLFGDYHVVQPFPQLGREVLACTDEEKKTDTLVRFVGVKIPGSRFFTLKHRGWSFRDYQLGKSTRDGMALLHTEPGLDFLSSRPEEQTLGEISFYCATRTPATFGDLSPIEASELLRDITLLVK